MRSQSRVFAFKIIFSSLFGSDVSSTKENFFDTSVKADQAFFDSIISAFAEHQIELTQKLENVLENYAIDRIYKVDLALIYLGMTEILYIQTPKAVVINEVVEIAKKFSTENSQKFVHGVLAKID